MAPHELTVPMVTCPRLVHGQASQHSSSDGRGAAPLLKGYWHLTAAGGKGERFFRGVTAGALPVSGR